MPEAKRYSSEPNSDTWRKYEEAWRLEMRGRQQVLNLAFDYYYGMHKQHLKPDGTNTEDNVTVNLVGLISDKGVSALMGTNEDGVIVGPDFEIAEDMQKQQAAKEQPALQKMMGRARKMVGDMMGMPSEDDMRPEKDYLDTLWKVNQKELKLHGIALNGGLSGHWFIKIDPTHPLEDPEGQGRLFPRLIVMNPANICKYWDRDDTERTLWYTSIVGDYSMGRWDVEAYRQDIVRNVNDRGEDTGGWTIYEYEIPERRVEWVLANTVVWNFPFPPMVDGPNLPRPNSAYGCNDLDIQVIDPKQGNAISRGLVGLNDSYNFTLSNMQRIIKHHAHPKTIGLGISEDMHPDAAINNFWTTDVTKDKAEIKSLEMQSELGSSLEFAKMVRGGIFTAARELDPNTVQDKVGQLTNFGIRVLSNDKVDKTGTKRLLYGIGLKQICQYCLEIAGFGENIEIAMKWPPPLPTDPLQMAQALMLDRQNGLSQNSYLERRGYDPEVEAQLRERERSEQVEVQQALGDGQTGDKMVSLGQMQRAQADARMGRNGNENGGGQ